MPKVRVDDAELYYETRGAGFPLVLSHTARTSLDNFSENTQASDGFHLGRLKEVSGQGQGSRAEEDRPVFQDDKGTTAFRPRLSATDLPPVAA